MAKKKRRKVISKKKLKEKRLAAYPQPIFSLGDLVQVNNGVMDANWEELPIGGWVGSVTKIDREPDGPKYEVIWTEETLKKAHPIFEQLASLEGLNINEYHGLMESELHLFPGDPVVLVEPEDVSMFTDRPLDPKDHTDRLRMIFDTKPLDWFPMLGDDEGENDAKILQRYYEYLSEHLVFPFEAVYINREKDRVTKHPFTVEKLVDPKAVRHANWVDDGVYCSGTKSDGRLIDLPLKNIVIFNDIPQKQLLADYRSQL